MQTEFHPAKERGHANHGWLDTWHSFSFAEYFNPIRERFGVLRVLNEDFVLGGTGFGEHPHNDMEIVTIPLEGMLEHRDDLGHTEVIGSGDVQVMSAGTGIRHSEYNHSKVDPVHFLQLWIHTRSKNAIPRYDQRKFDSARLINSFQCIVSPDNQQVEGSLWVYQDAWISMSRIEEENVLLYNLYRKENVVFVFVIAGQVNVSGQEASSADAVGITQSENLLIKSNMDSKILVIEVPVK